MGNNLRYTTCTVTYFIWIKSPMTDVYKQDKISLPLCWVHPCCALFYFYALPTIELCDWLKTYILHIMLLVLDIHHNSPGTQYLHPFKCHSTELLHSFIWLGHSNSNTCRTSFFWEKKFCQSQKKSRLCHGRKWFRNFLSDSKKKKMKKMKVLRIFIVRVYQSTTGIYQCCRRDSDLRMYISHPSGYRDKLIDWFYFVENRLSETSRYQS